MPGIDVKDLLRTYEDIWSDDTIPYPGRPLRLVDIKSMVKHGKLVFVPGTPGLKFCIISYTWETHNRNRESPYLLEQISPFTVEGLSSAAQVCHMLKHNYFWIDALCINQKRTSKEKQREISNMGKYYTDATECIIFPQGLNIHAEILPGGKLPRWCNRSWTLQEWILPRKKTFVFGLNAKRALGYSSVWGRIEGTILKTTFGKCVCMDSRCFINLIVMAGRSWTGKAPFKADEQHWNDIGREASYMYETNCARKGDILQRAMFRESKYEEDKIYSLLTVFPNVTMNIEYGIGLDEVLRRFAEQLSSDELARMLLTNWYSAHRLETSSDLSALPTFERQTAAVWFNMGKVEAVGKYIRSEGVQLTSRIIKGKMIMTGLCDDDLLDSINDNSDLPMKNIQLITPSVTFEAYGCSLYETCDVALVLIGKFDRIQSALTSARADLRDLHCCLLCTVKENTKLHKIGMCICDLSELDEHKIASTSTVILG